MQSNPLVEIEPADSWSAMQSDARKARAVNVAADVWRFDLRSASAARTSVPLLRTCSHASVAIAP